MTHGVLYMIDDRNFTKYLNETDIEAIVLSLSNQVSRDYHGKPLVLVGVLKGACILMADLCRNLKVEVEIDFVRLTSVGRASANSGTISFVKDLSVDVRDKHVLIVEEIVDSGRTLKFLYDRILAAKPASLEVLTFLDKHGKRMVDVPVKYAGRIIDDQFLVGYGLDLEEKCRNLPEIYFLKYPN